MTSSVYEIAMITALANFQENSDWVHTVSNSACQLLALGSLQADVNRLLELAFKGMAWLHHSWAIWYLGVRLTVWVTGQNLMCSDSAMYCPDSMVGTIMYGHRAA